MQFCSEGCLASHQITLVIKDIRRGIRRNFQYVCLAIITISVDPIGVVEHTCFKLGNTLDADRRQLRSQGTSKLSLRHWLLKIAFLS